VGWIDRIITEGHGLAKHGLGRGTGWLNGLGFCYCKLNRGNYRTRNSELGF
jgi:hypothetical protein